MDRSYVIILDGDINNPTDFEYVAERNTLGEIRKVEQYSANDRQSKSKEDYSGDFLEDKKVVNTETGDEASGQICKLDKIGD